MSVVELYNEDCNQALKRLPDNSVDLIVTDPPYYKVKKNEWDNQWSSQKSFLAWLDRCFAEFWRVLKPAGSLYVFCSPSLVSETELLIKERFNVVNNIVWRKPRGRHNGCYQEGLRRYYTQTERIIFAEQFGADENAKGKVGYGKSCQQVKAAVFKPLIEYFIQAKESAGIKNKQINEATGTQMARHWFSYSQWSLPSKQQYATLQNLFRDAAEGLNGGLFKERGGLSKPYQGLRREYEELRREYEELCREYEELRRPFSVTKDVPYTDVWDFSSVPSYKVRHPCEKPIELMRHIVKASTREGMTVLDAFMGHGNAGIAAVENGCDFIGIERDVNYFGVAKGRLDDCMESSQSDRQKNAA